MRAGFKSHGTQSGDSLATHIQAWAGGRGIGGGRKEKIDSILSVGGWQ